MDIKLIRTFIPSKDVTISKQFYLDLGFKILWEGDDLIIFGTKENNFFLQKYYQKEWAENVMMQMHLTDLDAFYQVVEDAVSRYEGCKIKPIFTADYGRTFHLIDPAGVLWHFTEVIDEDADRQEAICND